LLDAATCSSIAATALLLEILCKNLSKVASDPKMKGVIHQQDSNTTGA